MSINSEKNPKETATSYLNSAVETCSWRCLKTYPEDKNTTQHKQLQQMT